MDSAELPLTFHFAAEIEESAISILWHEPDRLGEFCRNIDPAVHISLPRVRIILEAIDLAWRELGATDFVTVAQVVAELSRLEDVGGRDGLNHIFLIAEFRSCRENTDAIFAHYVDMLKTYADARNVIPMSQVYAFTGGRGTVERNKARLGRHDHFIGESVIRGRRYFTKIEVSPDGNTLNLRFDPKS